MWNYDALSKKTGLDIPVVKNTGQREKAISQLNSDYTLSNYPDGKTIYPYSTDGRVLKSINYDKVFYNPASEIEYEMMKKYSNLYGDKYGIVNSKPRLQDFSNKRSYDNFME